MNNCNANAPIHMPELKVELVNAVRALDVDCVRCLVDRVRNRVKLASCGNPTDDESIEMDTWSTGATIAAVDSPDNFFVDVLKHTTRSEMAVAAFGLVRAYVEIMHNAVEPLVDSDFTEIFDILVDGFVHIIKWLDHNIAYWGTFDCDDSRWLLETFPCVQWPIHTYRINSLHRPSVQLQCFFVQLVPFAWRAKPRARLGFVLEAVELGAKKVAHMPCVVQLAFMTITAYFNRQYKGDGGTREHRSHNGHMLNIGLLDEQHPCPRESAARGGVPSVSVNRLPDSKLPAGVAVATAWTVTEELGFPLPPTKDSDAIIERLLSDPLAEQLPPGCFVVRGGASWPTNPVLLDAQLMTARRKPVAAFFVPDSDSDELSDSPTGVLALVLRGDKRQTSPRVIRLGSTDLCASMTSAVYTTVPSNVAQLHPWFTSAVASFAGHYGVASPSRRLSHASNGLLDDRVVVVVVPPLPKDAERALHALAIDTPPDANGRHDDHVLRAHLDSNAEYAAKLGFGGYDQCLQLVQQVVYSHLNNFYDMFFNNHCVDDVLASLSEWPDVLKPFPVQFHTHALIEAAKAMRSSIDPRALRAVGRCVLGALTLQGRNAASACMRTAVAARRRFHRAFHAVSLVRYMALRQEARRVSQQSKLPPIAITADMKLGDLMDLLCQAVSDNDGDAVYRSFTNPAAFEAVSNTIKLAVDTGLRRAEDDTEIRTFLAVLFSAMFRPVHCAIGLATRPWTTRCMGTVVDQLLAFIEGARALVEHVGLPATTKGSLGLAIDTAHSAEAQWLANTWPVGNSRLGLKCFISQLAVFRTVTGLQRDAVYDLASFCRVRHTGCHESEIVRAVATILVYVAGVQPRTDTIGSALDIIWNKVLNGADHREHFEPLNLTLLTTDVKGFLASCASRLCETDHQAARNLVARMLQFITLFEAGTKSSAFDGCKSACDVVVYVAQRAVNASKRVYVKFGSMLRSWFHRWSVTRYMSRLVGAAPGQLLPASHLKDAYLDAMHEAARATREGGDPRAFERGLERLLGKRREAYGAPPTEPVANPDASSENVEKKVKRLQERRKAAREFQQTHNYKYQSRPMYQPEQTAKKDTEMIRERVQRFHACRNREMKRMEDEQAKKVAKQAAKQANIERERDRVAANRALQQAEATRRAIDEAAKRVADKACMAVVERVRQERLRREQQAAAAMARVRALNADAANRAARVVREREAANHEAAPVVRRGKQRIFKGELFVTTASEPTKPRVKAVETITEPPPAKPAALIPARTAPQSSREEKAARKAERRVRCNEAAVVLTRAARGLLARRFARSLAAARYTEDIEKAIQLSIESQASQSHDEPSPAHPLPASPVTPHPATVEHAERAQSSSLALVFECAVCLDACLDPHAIVDCGHMFCGKCVKSLTICATCRAPITKAVRLYA